MAGSSFNDMMIRTLQAADGNPNDYTLGSRRGFMPYPYSSGGNLGRFGLLRSNEAQGNDAPMGTFGMGGAQQAPRMTMGFQSPGQGYHMPPQMQPDTPWSLSPSQPRPAGPMPVAQPPAVHSQPMTPAVAPPVAAPSSTAQTGGPAPSPAPQFDATSIMGFNPLASMGSPQTAADQIAGGDIGRLAARTYRNDDGSAWNDYYLRKGQG